MSAALDWALIIGLGLLGTVILRCIFVKGWEWILHE